MGKLVEGGPNYEEVESMIHVCSVNSQDWNLVDTVHNINDNITSFKGR